MNKKYSESKHEYEPKVYIACLASYVAGHLHGRWIDATLEVEEIQAEIEEILASSPVPDAEEWAAHDYEDFEEAALGEYPSLSELVETARFINAYGKLGIKLLGHVDDLEQAKKALEECYIGEYESLEYYAQEITEDTISIPVQLQYYIDYQAMARDMELNGDIFKVETGYNEVHIFINF
jgi:antirestriction protein